MIPGHVAKAVLFFMFMAGAAHAQSRGTLIAMGGGPWHDEVQKRFVELAGGAQGMILVLPMASASADSGRSSVAGWQEYGISARALVVSRDEAMRADTAALFRGVTGIWFGGGDQSRLTAAIAGTPVEAAIRHRYQKAGRWSPAQRQLAGVHHHRSRQRGHRGWIRLRRQRHH
jgi:cyanophycinase